MADDAASLKQSLGQTDRRKVDEYFTSVRELELRIARAEQDAQPRPSRLRGARGRSRDLREHIRLMYDLMALAFQTDTTRVVTFMLANEGSNRTYPMVGVNDGHHELSHHRDDQDKVAKLQKIDQFLVSSSPTSSSKLASIKEGDGTLLDNSMILYGSGISDGNRHRHDDLPIILAGRGGGTITTGRHVRIERGDAAEQPVPLDARPHRRRRRRARRQHRPPLRIGRLKDYVFFRDANQRSSDAELSPLARPATSPSMPICSSKSGHSMA